MAHYPCIKWIGKRKIDMKLIKWNPNYYYIIFSNNNVEIINFKDECIGRKYYKQMSKNYSSKMDIVLYGQISTLDLPELLIYNKHFIIEDAMDYILNCSYVSKCIPLIKLLFHIYTKL